MAVGLILCRDFLPNCLALFSGSFQGSLSGFVAVDAGGIVGCWPL
ncbi:hypothetical protein O4H49_11210 [Kiloniella laminariae]|uniref:Uncharacterized protein n=1 Tax=Kiloniella laminariae TaxID=454162 RepID=A0ABT4LJR5_9PROT|nr:hypothetical protein [Kiloniella laminariae]MCZ4281349.1 hypothetical protein [Kiloniella laminariae]